MFSFGEASQLILLLEMLLEFDGVSIRLCLNITGLVLLFEVLRNCCVKWCQFVNLLHYDFVKRVSFFGGLSDKDDCLVFYFLHCMCRTRSSRWQNLCWNVVVVFWLSRNKSIHFLNQEESEIDSFKGARIEYWILIILQ